MIHAPNCMKSLGSIRRSITRLNKNLSPLQWSFGWYFLMISGFKIISSELPNTGCEWNHGFEGAARWNRLDVQRSSELWVPVNVILSQSENTEIQHWNPSKISISEVQSEPRKPHGTHTSPTEAHIPAIMSLPESEKSGRQILDQVS